MPIRTIRAISLMTSASLFAFLAVFVFISVLGYDDTGKQTLLIQSLMFALLGLIAGFILGAIQAWCFNRIGTFFHNSRDWITRTTILTLIAFPLLHALFRDFNATLPIGTLEFGLNFFLPVWVGTFTLLSIVQLPLLPAENRFLWVIGNFIGAIGIGVLLWVGTAIYGIFAGIAATRIIPAKHST